MRRQDFAYHLPADLIAQEPLAERSAGRMLVLDGVAGALLDRTIRDLPEYLREGDLLIVNDTRVIAARLIGTKPSGGRVEILLERALPARQALAQLSASKPIRAGLEVLTAGGVVRVLAREAELWRIELPAPALEFFERFGEVPLPPYIRRAPGPGDRERYQSMFAREPGAVAAPTAPRSGCSTWAASPSPRSGWKVPAPTCSVMQARRTPRTASAALSASSKCRLAVGAATAPGSRAKML